MGLARAGGWPGRGQAQEAGRGAWSERAGTQGWVGGAGRVSHPASCLRECAGVIKPDGRNSVPQTVARIDLGGGEGSRGLFLPQELSDVAGR